MRNAVVTLALVAMASPLAAQQQQAKDPDPTHKVAGGALPAGWQVRLDDKDAKRGMTAADTKFVAMGGGYHVTSGPAALYYAPKDAMKGQFTVSATLTQTKAPMHPEAYGLFVGGAHLGDSTQTYLYFLVRETPTGGQFLINHRAGNDVHKLVEWTANAAIKPADASGAATNALSIRVASDSVRFLVNDTQVQAFSRAQMPAGLVDGIAGIRVNHNLDVHVASFTTKSGAR